MKGRVSSNRALHIHIHSFSDGAGVDVRAEIQLDDRRICKTRRVHVSKTSRTSSAAKEVLEWSKNMVNAAGNLHYRIFSKSEKLSCEI